MAMNKFNRIIQFIIRFSLTWGLLYLAFVEDFDGARNVILAFAWVAIILSFTFLSEKMIDGLKSKPKDILYKIDKVDDFIICGIFLWFGWMWTGAGWLIATLIAIAAMEEAHKEESS